MIKKKEEKKSVHAMNSQSIAETQYEKGNCFKCDFWDGWEACCDIEDISKCPFLEGNENEVRRDTRL
jgi:hypothetical protein